MKLISSLRLRFKQHGMIAPGEPAPDFEADDHLGRHLRLRDLLEAGPVLLVFYPMDGTPACTRQLCALRDGWQEFRGRGVSVLGINPGGGDSHAAFASRHSFPFPVLVDTGSRIAAAYGARGLLVPKRTVYLVGPDGRVLLAERGMVPHDRIFNALDRVVPGPQGPPHTA